MNPNELYEIIKPVREHWPAELSWHGDHFRYGDFMHSQPIPVEVVAMMMEATLSRAVIGPKRRWWVVYKMEGPDSTGSLWSVGTVSDDNNRRCAVEYAGPTLLEALVCAAVGK